MQIKLNQKIIKERCGVVTFKKGEAFYRNGKVTIGEVTPNSLQATVEGVDCFQVHLEKDPQGFQATCSCPSLSSIDKDCQHVGAVLIAWYHYQQEMIPDEQTADQTEGELPEELLRLFESKQPSKSGKQLHFENRQVLNTTFFCKGVTVKGDARFGIEISIATHRVDDIRDFLESVKAGRSYALSMEFLYDPTKQCFDNGTDAVIQQLILVMDDEKMYRQALPTAADYQDKGILLVPASFWKNVEPLLVRTPQVNLQYNGKSFPHFRVSDESLPLTFEFTGTDENGYQLMIYGLSEMMILKEYDTVLSAGKVVVIKRGEAERLYELNRMLEMSGTNEIPIPGHQLKYFMEKLLPSLRKMGEVHLSGEITTRLRKTPLQAKLYLDRVNNRLLAGLEFHYENVVINPLDYRLPKIGSMTIRDMEKEEEILQLMRESQFNQTESGYYLQNEELEYNFLYHQLPKLQKVVQVYATTAVRIRIVPKTTIPKIKVKHYKERNHLLEFSFKIDGIPETEIKEVLAALEEKRKYYRLRDGALLSLETREMEEIKRFLHAVPVQDDEWEKRFEVPVVEGLRLLNYFEESDVVSHEASFRKFLEKLQHPERLQFKVPEGLDGVLRNYQKHGFKWMKTLASYGFGGILADDMGLGSAKRSHTSVA